MMIRASCLLLAAMGCVSVGAYAQDLDAEPVSGTVLLKADFQADPRIALVRSGGPVDLRLTKPGCEGFVTSAPLIRLNYTAMPRLGAFPLFIHVFARGDTTLLVNAPDGSWYCNDDGMNGKNPMVVFGPAISGDYDIWLGSFQPAETHRAIIAFSEVGADVRGLDAELGRPKGR